MISRGFHDTQQRYANQRDHLRQVDTVDDNGGPDCMPEHSLYSRVMEA